MGVQAVMGLDTLLRRLRIIPPLEEEEHSPEDYEVRPEEVDEIRLADERGQRMLQNAAKRIVRVQRGEMDEWEFWSLLHHPTEGNLQEDTDDGMDDE